MSSRRSIDRNDEVDVITADSEYYPQTLHRLGRLKPPTLYFRGNIELLNRPAVSIIGARDSTEYGDSVAEMLAADLARRGVVIISGLARGIDSIAHEAALAAGGTTIAVLGCGIDVYYPPSNARLQERIAEEGLLISEFDPGAPAMKHHFPYRNRIIALMPRAVIVVEAKHKSGTRRTIDWALKYGGDIFAVPGPIGRAESQGTNAVIQEGAHILTSTADVLQFLGLPLGTSALNDSPNDRLPTDGQAGLMNQLDMRPRHIDDLARRSALSPAEILAQLLQLEMEGLVMQHAGKRFSLIRQQP